ncbi:MAG: hypothetical protein WDN28_16650 [Chthoniobacter sp.]
MGVCFPGGPSAPQGAGPHQPARGEVCAPGQDQIRLTNKQNLLIVNVLEANLPALKAELDELGLDYQPTNFRKGCVSCTGIEFCNLAVSETKNRMLELITQLENNSSWYHDKIRIHFSGCPSSCGQHQIADIGFRGARTKVNGEMVDAFDAFIGGRLGANRRFNDLLKGKIIARDVHPLHRQAPQGLRRRQARRRNLRRLHRPRAQGRDPEGARLEVGRAHCLPGQFPVE